MRVAEGWWWLGRGGLCLPYAYSGFDKLLDFPGAVAALTNLGLQPAPMLVATVIVVQLGGCILVMCGKRLWRMVGALVLGMFTIIATVVGHAFWEMSGMGRLHHLDVVLAHAGLVGGFILVAAQAMHRGRFGDEEEEEEEEED